MGSIDSSRSDGLVNGSPVVQGFEKRFGFAGGDAKRSCDEVAERFAGVQFDSVIAEQFVDAFDYFRANHRHLLLW